MSIKLTQADKKYIKYIFTTLDKCHHKALKKGNHFDAHFDYYDKKYAGTEEVWLDMMEAFSFDLKNNTQNFTYTLPNQGYIQRIEKRAYQSDVSSWLMVRFLSLTTQKIATYINFLYYALKDKRLDLFLLCLNQKTIYQAYLNNHSDLFKKLCHGINLAIVNFPEAQNLIEEGFIYHIKHSNLNFEKHYFNEQHLIKAYIELFKKTNVNPFLLSLGLKMLPELFEPIEKDSLALFNLNLNNLASTTLSVDDIEEISQLLLIREFDFPAFYLICQSENSLIIGAEIEPNLGHEKTIKLTQAFIETLINSSYQREEDKDYEKISNLILKVKLDFQTQPHIHSKTKNGKI